MSKYILHGLQIKELLKRVTISKSAKLSFCEGCVEGIMHRQPFKLVEMYICVLREICSVYTVMCVNQCRRSQLEGGNTTKL